jgi:hypothetical protein
LSDGLGTQPNFVTTQKSTNERWAVRVRGREYGPRAVAAISLT